MKQHQTKPIIILRPSCYKHSFSYQIAGCEINSNFLIPAMQPFIRHARKRTLPAWQRPKPIKPNGRVLYSQKAWLGNRYQPLCCIETPQGYYLYSKKIGIFTIHFNSRYSILHILARAPETIVQEMIVGPLLILALAQQQIYCLHASSVVLHHQAIAFIGDSGQGKSTLARFLSQDSYPLLTDDIMPVAIQHKKLLLYSRFPQLKLKKQAGVKVNEAIAISALCFLQKGQSQKACLAMQPFSPSLALLKILQHTASVRLFSTLQSAMHLYFCSKITDNNLLCQLSYPADRSQLQAIKQLLEKNF